MRLLSKIFQPTITLPKGSTVKNTELTCKSQKLLVQNGLVRPTSDGFFSLLPLGRRVLDKLEKLVHHHMDKVGAQEITLPSLTESQLWQKSGRIKSNRPELFIVKDRHEKNYLLAPTHEEAISDLLSEKGQFSYKQLPLLLYQISNKYRDECRPKHGLLRAREFRMMDAYSLHTDQESVLATYNEVTKAYMDIFKTLNLPVHRVEAPPGDMGGTLSHEWQLLAAVGEDSVLICPSCSHAALAVHNVCGKCGEEAELAQGIEVGHTFVLGSRYSEPLRANFVNYQGSPAPFLMASYGIGLTRLLAASVEALSFEKKIRWPSAIAPYSVVVIGPKGGSKEWDVFDFERTLEVSRAISEAGFDVVVDDRHTETIGKRYLMADQMGYPNVVVCGRKAVQSPPRFELYNLVPGEMSQPELCTMDELITTLNERKRTDEEIPRLVATSKS